MRLINCKELFLKEFVVDPPKYAVLSHRWYEFEVAFQDFHTVQDDRELVLDDREKQGIRKIQNTCRVALEYGLEWVWIDTCCIDKNNNTELSEAINSMYRWYANATLCLIYLADVAALKDLKVSDWFKRGWTLQELLAPRKRILFTKDWDSLGFLNGSSGDLSHRVSGTTGVPRHVILHGLEVPRCAAEIMSWAAGRRTTKEEDIAYCLMGFFDVHMPLLYGEGANAFQRLQQHILQRGTDHSLLAFVPEQVWNPGPLATSPDEFRDCGMMICAKSFSGQCSINNYRLWIDLRLTRRSTEGEILSRAIAVLDCYGPTKMRLGIPLISSTHYSDSRLWHRSGKDSGPVELDDDDWRTAEESRTICIAARSSAWGGGNRATHRRWWCHLHSGNKFFISEDLHSTERGKDANIEPASLQFSSRTCLSMNDEFQGMLCRHQNTGELFVLVIGIYNDEIMLDVLTLQAQDSLQSIVENYVVNLKTDDHICSLYCKCSRTKTSRLSSNIMLPSGREIFLIRDDEYETSHSERPQSSTLQSRSIDLYVLDTNKGIILNGTPSEWQDASALEMHSLDAGKLRRLQVIATREGLIFCPRGEADVPTQ